MAQKTVLDRIPRYRRTALKEECLYILVGGHAKAFFSMTRGEVIKPPKHAYVIHGPEACSIPITVTRIFSH